jgi:hypothetical protein
MSIFTNQDSSNWTYRVDTLPFKHYEVDGDGYLKFIAPIAKVGTLRYYSNNDEYYDEIVLAETLIDSLESFKNKPITLLHPEEKVTPANARKYQRGLTGYSGYFDGKFLWLTGTATDQELIQQAIAGNCKELSCGYDALIGIVDGKRYQLKRHGNHLAFVPKGRAGSDVSLRLDNDSRVVEYRCDEDLGSLTIPDALYEHFRGDKFIVSITGKPATKDNAKVTTQILFQDQVYNLDGEDAISLKQELASFIKEANTWKQEAVDLKAKLDSLESLNEKVSDLEKEKARLEGELAATRLKLDEVVANRLDSDAINREVANRLKTWSEVLPYLRKQDASFVPDYTMNEYEIKKLYLSSRVKGDQKSYMDSLDIGTDVGKAAIDGLFFGLKPSVDAEARQTTHTDGIYTLIVNSESASDKDNEDPRMRLQKLLETR